MKKFPNLIILLVLALNLFGVTYSLLSPSSSVQLADKLLNANKDESDKISIIMETLLPSMFGLFSNITDAQFKSNFQEPCTFDKLLEIFGQLPPYFDLIAKRFPTKADLVAYYSMQLASTFLVNNGSLTMKCLYNMLALQTRLQTFSLDLMDNPEKNMPLVGVFGIFMKPIMSRLKKNAMMKIIEHIDKYEKNDDLSTISVFNSINIFYCTFGLCAIICNIFLIILLKRSTARQSIKKCKKSKIYKPLNQKSNMPLPLPLPQTNQKPKQNKVNKKGKKQVESKYKQVKTRNLQINQLIRKKYKTRICFILIAICHSVYILLNFIVMSQASLASVALKGLTQLNIACKMAFFLFPPTTAYNIVHQLAIWLLVYIVRKHAIKLRTTKTHNFDENADYDVDVINYDSDTDEDDANRDEEEYTFERNLYDDDDDNPSRLNSNSGTNRSIVPFNLPNRHHHNPISLQIMSTNHFHQHNYYPVPNVYNGQQQQQAQQKKIDNQNTSCSIFTRKSRNLHFAFLVLLILLAYNAQNLMFYSLNRLQTSTSTIYFCAFEETYSEYYSVLNQYIVPILNLVLFSVAPLLLCTIQVLFDICFLVRVKREQMKRYYKLKEIIEWPVYVYFVVYLISQIPFSLHQIIDLAMGSIKFPFVFPLFIQMKFSNKVWLVIFEQTLIFLAFSSDLFIWLACDKQMRELAAYYLNKRILCRTYSKKEKDQESGSSGCNGGAGTTTTTSSSMRSSTKSSSDSSVINDDSIKSQPMPTHQISGNMNGYESSTLTSNASSTNKKKQLSMNLADSIKATAAIPASIQHSTVYPYEKQEDELLATSQNGNGIKMIDTDNEDLDNLNDLSLDNPNMIKQNLERLSENEDDSTNESNVSGSHKKINYSFNTYDLKGSNSNPPSFKSAVNKEEYKKQVYNSDKINTSNENQYQNI